MQGLCITMKIVVKQKETYQSKDCINIPSPTLYLSSIMVEYDYIFKRALFGFSVKFQGFRPPGPPP